ncbi:MAG: hypothetical protein RI894_1502 [Bacteroidota bacterium]|jgi:hypothetical protein
MNLSMLIAVSGTIAGIFRIHSNRNNGLVAEDLSNNKRLFIPQRGNSFTPLESISIYTEDDTVSLASVLQVMKDKLDDLEVPSPKSTEEEMRAYFEQVLPDYDRDRVYLSDIRKVLRWFTALDACGVIDADPPAAETTETEAVEVAETAE